MRIVYRRAGMACKIAIIAVLVTCGWCSSWAGSKRSSPQETQTPLYGERLRLNVQQAETNGAIYQGAGTVEQFGNGQQQSPAIVSANVNSVCIFSGCLGSVCWLSGCYGSVCMLSGCAGSACGGSACQGSACGGSVCQGSACFGSVCVGSGCVGSVCATQACTSCTGMLGQNAYDWLNNTKSTLASNGYSEPLGPGLTWEQNYDPVLTSGYLLCNFAYVPPELPAFRGRFSFVLFGLLLLGSGVATIIRNTRG